MKGTSLSTLKGSRDMYADVFLCQFCYLSSIVCFSPQTNSSCKTASTCSLVTMAFTSSSVSSSSIRFPYTPGATCQNQSKPAFVTFPSHSKKPQSRLVSVSAVGDVSADGTTYLIAGAIAVALVGTAFPILFSRKDT
jgi:hypothetical protein